MRKPRRQTTVDKDLFNFADTSDLPEDIAAKLQTDATDRASIWADIIHKGAAAGLAELEITQIMAVAHRLGLEVPKQHTVRNYLNKAVELGLVSKPTRQSYAVGTRVHAPQAESAGLGGDEVKTSEPVEASRDPLADLGV